MRLRKLTVQRELDGKVSVTGSDVEPECKLIGCLIHKESRQDISPDLKGDALGIVLMGQFFGGGPEPLDVFIKTVKDQCDVMKLSYPCMVTEFPTDYHDARLKVYVGQHVLEISDMSLSHKPYEIASMLVCHISYMKERGIL